jgi:hypothetical protein
MDVYTFDYEDDDFGNYRSIHPGDNDDGGGLKYSCPNTGAHFEFTDICSRLAMV